MYRYKKDAKKRSAAAVAAAAGGSWSGAGAGDGEGSGATGGGGSQSQRKPPLLHIVQSAATVIQVKGKSELSDDDGSYDDDTDGSGGAVTS